MTALGLAGIALMVVMMGGMLFGGMGMMRHKGGGHAHQASETAVCPVSGKTVAVSSAAAQATVGGKLYYFDDEEHMRQFVLDPGKFLRPPAEGR